MGPVFTIGHSTRALDELLSLLREHEVELVADVRRHPGSRRYPHFHRDALARSLEAAGIDYAWLPELGGRRKEGDDASSPNAGLRNASFRRYADYMQTPAFRDALDDLLGRARAARTSLLCAEAVYWRCHRRLIADALAARGVEVRHILTPGRAVAHALTPGASLDGERVTYPGDS